MSFDGDLHSDYSVNLQQIMRAVPQNSSTVMALLEA
jgi:hypothetical protein